MQRVVHQSMFFKQSNDKTGTNMKPWHCVVQIMAIVFLCFLSPPTANATCAALPNNLTNGQLADASQVMANFNSLLGCVNNNGVINGGTAGQVGVYISSGSTISGESPSALLDSAFGTSQGALLYRGSAGWSALPPGTAGQVLATGGVSANPSWTNAVGGTSPFWATVQPSSASAFSLVKATGLTATLSNMPSGRGMMMNITGAGTNSIASMEQPVVSQSAFTVTTCIYLASSLAGNWFLGIGVSDSSGKYDSFGWRNGSLGSGIFNEFQFSSINTYVASSSFYGAFNPNGPVWLRLQLTGGNFIFSASFDGENWDTVQTVSATHYLGSTLSKVGIIAYDNSTYHMFIDDLSWSQTTP
jgi:hypothetical protein